MIKKLIFIGSVFLIDQTLKHISVEPIISRVTYHPWPLIISFIALAITTYFCFRVKNIVQQWGLVFLVAGGISNLYDYAVFHGVRDYLIIGSIYFNAADILILCGTILICLPAFFFSSSWRYY